VSTNTLFETQLASLPLLGRGKVRDLYEADEDHLLIVTTDRLSAFDVVMPQGIPGKGKVLTEIAQFWFNRLRDIVPNHLSDKPLSDYLTDAEMDLLDGRGMLAHKLKPLPIEAVVRGYLIGSGWSEYQRGGKVCGIELPPGLRQAEKLPQSIFTPATKADVGDHDENIDFQRAAEMIGLETATAVRDISIRLYNSAAAYAASKGIIIADTKFEFGLNESGELILIDEALTPDSSRFWPADQYQVGSSPVSFDKQFVRDYLETLDWDKKAPGPQLPEHIIRQTRDKYLEALEKLTM
jgi:phosphoribosylaminoimidazole-succinocarboxamide synthase